MSGDGFLDQWVAALAAELGVETADVDVQAILDVARDAAHNVMRPAAPVAAFMVGYAAGLKGGGSQPVADAAAAASAAALAWEGTAEAQ